MIEFSEEEYNTLSEYVDEVWSDYKVTRDRDGGIFSSSSSIGMKMSVKNGIHWKTSLDFQRLQCTNYLNAIHNNKRQKKIE